MTLYFSIAYVAVIVLVLNAAKPLPVRVTIAPTRPPWATIGLFLLVAIPSLLQFAYPGLYDLLHRDSDLIQHHGEWWRPFTSFVVQDGGVAGTAYNLLLLAFVGVLAERVWGSLTVLAIWFGTLAFFAIESFLMSQPSGGGNSISTYRLATTLAGLALVLLPKRSWKFCAGIAVIAIGLVAFDDNHGEPMLAGMVLGAAIGYVQLRLGRRERVTAPRAATPAAG